MKFQEKMNLTPNKEVDSITFEKLKEQLNKVYKEKGYKINEPKRINNCVKESLNQQLPPISGGTTTYDRMKSINNINITGEKMFQKVGSNTNITTQNVTNNLTNLQNNTSYNSQIN